MQRGYLVQEPMLKPMYSLSPMHFGVYPVVLDGFAQYGSAQADPTIMARKMRRAGRGARRWNASIIICERRAATQRSGQLRITMPERVARAQPQAAASRWLADSIRSNAAAQQAGAQAGDRRRCAAKHDRSERRFAGKKSIFGNGERPRHLHESDSFMASSFNPFRLIHTSHPSRHDMTRRVVARAVFQRHSKHR
jgi:hypothetical protein